MSIDKRKKTPEICNLHGGDGNAFNMAHNLVCPKCAANEPPVEPPEEPIDPTPRVPTNAELIEERKRRKKAKEPVYIPDTAMIIGGVFVDELDEEALEDDSEADKDLVEDGSPEDEDYELDEADEIIEPAPDDVPSKQDQGEIDDYVPFDQVSPKDRIAEADANSRHSRITDHVEYNLRMYKPNRKPNIGYKMVIPDLSPIGVALEVTRCMRTLHHYNKAREVQVHSFFIEKKPKRSYLIGLFYVQKPFIKVVNKKIGFHRLKPRAAGSY